MGFLALFYIAAFVFGMFFIAHKIVKSAIKNVRIPDNHLMIWRIALTALAIMSLLATASVYTDDRPWEDGLMKVGGTLAACMIIIAGIADGWIVTIRMTLRYPARFDQMVENVQAERERRQAKRKEREQWKALPMVERMQIIGERKAKRRKESREAFRRWLAHVLTLPKAAILKLSNNNKQASVAVSEGYFNGMVILVNALWHAWIVGLGVVIAFLGGMMGLIYLPEPFNLGAVVGAGFMLYLAVDAVFHDRGGFAFAAIVLTTPVMSMALVMSVMGVPLQVMLFLILTSEAAFSVYGILLGIGLGFTCWRWITNHLFELGKPRRYELVRLIPQEQ